MLIKIVHSNTCSTVSQICEAAFLGRPSLVQQSAAGTVIHAASHKPFHCDILLQDTMATAR